MLRLVRYIMTALLLAGTLAGGRARAENEGQDDLDRATELKLSADKLSDLAEVVRLCETALEKGLDGQNAEFATNLLASTLVERATLAGAATVKGLRVDPQWPNYRRLALADLDKAIKLVDAQPRAWLLIARLNLLPGGDRPRATEALDKTIAAAADNAGLRAKALTLRAGLQKDAPKRLADLNEAVRISPRDAGAVRARGITYAENGKPELALKDLVAAQKLMPQHAPTYEAKAIVLGELKKYDEALTDLDKARELAPNSVAPLTLRAQIHVAQSDLKGALQDLDEAYSMQPGNVIVLLLRAGVHDELGESEKAMADINQALKLRPKFNRARRMRAMLLAKAGKIDQVIAELEKLLNATPDDLTTRLQLAMFYTVERQSRKAIAIYSDILAAKPDSPQALRGRANALLGIGDHARAIEDYNKAVKLQPDEPGMLNNLAWVLATSPKKELRDGKRAIKLATRACELTDHKQAHILSTLAAAYAEAGDFKTAVKWSKKALQSGKAEKREDIREALEKEHKSFQAGKPWRELLSGEESER